jgi:Circularly permutated YpsA SLOG family
MTDPSRFDQMLKCLRSGGQSGVDRAALDVALLTSVAYAGWCVAGATAEDLPKVGSLKEKYPFLVETPTPIPEQRTAWNTRDSDATLVLKRQDALSPGTAFTVTCATLVFCKPCWQISLDGQEGLTDVATGIRALAGLLGRPIILNVAGPRQSESPGIYEAARQFLLSLIAVPGILPAKGD